ncbi:F-box protein CPR1-like [Bidens hawaiensis]|uniref:F-box protein CPR1-like n=1 Tax=Bidens hawaiensis TaxID=980011 RepID=UPI0040499628
MALDDDSQQPKRIKTLQTNLPTDIAAELLLRLPVESVLRCKSVCKSWYSLIYDPQFVKSHLAISTRSNNHHRLIYNTKVLRDSRQILKLKTCNLRDVLYDNSINNALDIDYPLRDPLKYVYAIASCNGLLCMAIMDELLFIWNPSTRKSYRLPPTGYRKEFGSYVLYGFGYDESTDDYKVVELSFNNKDKRETLVKIYSLKSGNWKKIDAIPHCFTNTFLGNFSNGALHWVTTKGLGPWAIISLDLAKESFGEVLQPLYDEGDKDLRLGCLNEWLCVLCDYRGTRADIWVMKDYGVKDSWTKLVSIPYLNVPWRERLLRPLCMSNDGKMLLQFGFRKVIVYDSKNNSYSEIQNLDRCLGACTPAAALGDI